MNISRRFLLGSLGALPMARLAAGATAHRLTILHMNDFHSRHEAVDGRALTCKAGERPDCFGGAARLATALAASRATAEAAGRIVVLLDAGDQFQGSLFYTAWHGEVELAVMHLLGTDAMTVGNHEFDNGPENLARFVKAAKFPVLSANVDASAEPALAGLLRPFTLLKRGAISIGVVGLTTLETTTGSSPGPNVRFTPPAAALQQAAAAARAQGAQIVVALSHLGVAEDAALAGRVPGVDIFVGGHSHTLLSDQEPGAAGPAHAAIAGPAGSAVVVQAGCFGRYVGRLDVDLDDSMRPVAFGGDTVHVGLDLPEEPRVAALVGGYAQQLDGVRRRVIGQAPAPVGTDGCRVGECALGNFIADAMLTKVRGADIAINNAGGMRTGLPAGQITLGDVLTLLPFGNTIASVKLRGADVQAALLSGLPRAGAGAFPQVAGLQLIWNPDSKTISDIRVRQPDGSFLPLDPQRLYLVVTNNFMRGGGDGYTIMRERGVDPYDAGPLLIDAVAEAISAAGPLAPRMDGRLVVRQ